MYWYIYDYTIMQFCFHCEHVAELPPQKGYTNYTANDLYISQNLILVIVTCSAFVEATADYASPRILHPNSYFDGGEIFELLLAPYSVPVFLLCLVKLDRETAVL